MKRKFLLLGLLFTVTCALFGQTYRYNFNNNFNAVGGIGPTLIEVQETNGGCPYVSSGFSNQTITTISGTCGTGVPAFDFNRSGLTFTNASLIGSTYTIHIFMKRNAPFGGGYDRVLDFSNGTSDNGIYTLDDCFIFYNGGVIGTCPNITANTYYLFSIVRDGGTKAISFYVNGVLNTSFTDTNDDFAVPNNTTPFLFFNDDGCDYGATNGNSVKYLSLSAATSTAGEVASVWTGICATVLPLRMIDFTASKQNDNSVLLNWVTDNEENTSHFELERSTASGSFSKIANVVSNNSVNRNNYNFTDRQPLSGINLYRLKIYDKDGQFKYSSVLKVTLSGKPVFEVFPNPAKDVITITGIRSNETIKLLNAEGRILMQKVSTGQSTTMDVSKFPSGMYIITYFDGEQTQRQKVIKQ
jgi:Secretion system C-terminal sorting domain